MTHVRAEKSTMVEGIGDELVYAVAGFCSLVIPLIWFINQRQNAEQHIHPESEENVRTVRNERGHQNRADASRPNNAHTDGTGYQQRPVQLNDGELECPVCITAAELAIQTNCGHIFCGACIISYWQHGTWLGAVNCPVCRQRVTILLVNFTPDEHNSNSEEKRRVVDSIYQYNRRYSGEPRSWLDHLRDLPTLLRHALREIFTVGGLVWMFRLRVLVCFVAFLLYFISPLDIIPEAAFGVIGFLDDIFIFLLLAIYVSLIYRQVVQGRANTAANQ